IQTVFNGVNLDDELTDENGRFVTLSVSGRGIVPRRINTQESPRKHGNIERGYTLDSREINVNFLLEDISISGFRDRFNRINDILSQPQKELKFTDEKAYFISTLSDADDPDEETKSMKGKLIFVCNDHLKRKTKHTITVENEENYTNTSKLSKTWTSETTISNDAKKSMIDKIIFLCTTPLKPNTKHTITVENEKNYTITGQLRTPWTSETTFTDDVSKYELTCAGKPLRLNYGFKKGDLLRIDYLKRRIRVNGSEVPDSVDIRSEWFKLTIGHTSISATEKTEITYTEMFY